MKLFDKLKRTPAEATVEAEISAAVQAAIGEEDSPRQSVPPAQSGRVPLSHRTWAKFTAFVLVVLAAGLTVGSAVGIIVMIEEQLYTTSESASRYRAFENMTDNDAYNLILYLSTNDDVAEQEAMIYLSGRNIATVEMKFSEGPRYSWVYDSGSAADDTIYQSTWYHMQRKDSNENWYSWYSYYNNGHDNATQIGTVDVRISLAKNFSEQDEYYFRDRFISIAYAMRYWAYIIGVASLLLFISGFVFLLCASGRRAGHAEPQPGWATSVPLDITTAAAGLSIFFAVSFAIEAQYGTFGGDDVLQVLLLVCCGIVILSIALGWCMSFALRVKLGGWWRNSVIYYVLRFLWRILKALGRDIAAIFRGIGSLLRGIPLVWKTVVAYLAVCVLEIFIFLFNWHYVFNISTYWLIKHCICFPFIIFIALTLRRLQKGGRALASGDLSYQVNTKRMPRDFKQHGENLNRIGEGMTAAVEQRLKSERMKTELITNVSHDIKTPLTSIINYSDLIEKEPCDNPKITEYADVLHRQSERLKRLIEDLVEASKASTGNLEVSLAPCEVGVLLTQTAGEYEQRLEQARLELVTRQPEQPVKILADGRRLWRVFDNLMNNICKYAQAGTRVYLTLEQENDSAVITFRNTSRDALNLSADEFMERFVRGDASRSSEGNGLGLSIAKSLTELQNGKFGLTVDGDLFKVVLSFPLIG